MFTSTVPKHARGALKDTHDFDAPSPQPLAWDLNDEDLDDAPPAEPEAVELRSAQTPLEVPTDVPASPAADAPGDGAPLSLALRPLTDEDIDRLWDWIREEDDKGTGFLGVAPPTSKALHAAMSAVPATGAAYAVDHAALGHVGVLLLNPIVVAERVAVTHLFLAAPLRNRLPQVVGQLSQIASALHSTVSFVVLTTRPAIARLYRGLGFETTYVLVRTPASQEQDHGT